MRNTLLTTSVEFGEQCFYFDVVIVEKWWGEEPFMGTSAAVQGQPVSGFHPIQFVLAMSVRVVHWLQLIAHFLGKPQKIADMRLRSCSRRRNRSRVRPA